MNEITLPVQYDKLDLEGIKSHLRYIKTLPGPGQCAEILLCESNVIVPVEKRNYKTKSDQIVFIFRSGSFSRDTLAKLKIRYAEKGYELFDSYTAKRKLLKRVSAPVNVDDPMLPLIGTNILQVLASQLKVDLAGNVSIGYAIGDENTDLPGTVKYNDPILQIGHKIGLMAGRTMKFIR
jgi:hypothetical protein